MELDWPCLATLGSTGQHFGTVSGTVVLLCRVAVSNLRDICHFVAGIQPSQEFGLRGIRLPDVLSRIHKPLQMANILVLHSGKLCSKTASVFPRQIDVSSFLPRLTPVSVISIEMLKHFPVNGL